MRKQPWERTRRNKTTNHLGMKTVFYSIKNLNTNKTYIGQTIRYKKRVGEHIYHLRNGKHLNHELQTDFYKYGEESFKFEILEVVDGLNRVERIEYEENLIKRYKTREFGYNLLGIPSKSRI